MADRIKGITIEIDGDTTRLSKSLSGTNKEIRNTQQQLKDVERLLKLDPKNTELLSQKQKLLGQAVGETKTKLDSLKTAISGADKALANNAQYEQKYEPLQREIESTKTKLEELKVKDKDAKAQLSRGEISQTQYDGLQTEIKQTETDLESLKQEAKTLDDAFANRISTEQYDALQREIAQTETDLKSLEKASKSSSVSLSQIKTSADVVASSAKNVSSTMMPATVGILAIGGASIKMASDVEESNNKVGVAFGDSADEVRKFADGAIESCGLAEGTALDMASTFGDMGTSMGLSQGEASKMSTSMVQLSGDLASFKNISNDESMTALNGVFTGETESLKRLGVVMTQANLDNYAMANGFGKTTSEMTEAEKVNLRYAYVMDATKNAQGDFARTSDDTANATRVVSEKVKEASASIGEQLLPVIAKILGKVSEWIQKFTDLDDGTKKILIVIALLVASIAPIAGIIGGIATVVSAVTTIMPLLSGAFTALVGPIGIVIGVIAGVIAVGVLLYKNWDEIKEKAGQLKDWLGEKFAAIGTGIKNAVTGAKDAVTEKFNGIRDTMKSAMSEAKEQVSERLGAIKSAYEENGGGLKGIASGTMEAIKQYYKLGYDGINALTGGRLGDVASAFRDKMGEAENTVSNVMESIKNAFTDKLGQARDFVGGAIARIKSFFNFSWSLPHIKMPHFSISGSFSLKPPRIPKIGVQWYKYGGIMDGATMFGMNGNNAMIGGEAGKEAILPLEGFYKRLDSMLDSKLGNGDTQMIAYLNNYMDGKLISKEVADVAIQKISRAQNGAMKAKGYA